MIGKLHCVALSMLLFCTACSGRYAVSGSQDSAASDSVSVVEVDDYTAMAHAWADSVMIELTDSQRVAQLLLPAVYASSDEATTRLVERYARQSMGGIVLLKGDLQSAARLSAEFGERADVAPFVAIDAEWGLAMRLADAPLFPANGYISADADDQDMYEYGRELARECRRVGINMILGPVVDIASVDSWLGIRSLGNDPVRVADLSVAYARGVEDGNVISVAKHFPGHGAVIDDSHKTLPVIEQSLHDMDSLHLYPFRQYIARHLSGIMAGHLAVPSIDPEMRPAAVSKVVITDLLRNDLGFDGLVLTDALNMGGAGGYGADDAIEAGADIVIAPLSTDSAMKQILSALSSGKIERSRLEESVRRILLYKYWLGLSERSEMSFHDIVKDVNTSPVSLDTLRNRLREGVSRVPKQE